MNDTSSGNITTTPKGTVVGTSATDNIASEGFKPGNIFEAVVKGMENNKVFLSLENGQVLTARLLDSDVSFSKGQNVSFLVKSNDGEQIAIKPVVMDLANNPAINKALTAAALPATAENLNMIKVMMDENMPVNKQGLMEMRKLLLQNPDTDTGTIVALKKNNIPITKDNINQFQNYKNNEAFLSKDIDRTIQNVKELFTNRTVFSEEKTLTGSNEDVLQENTKAFQELPKANPQELNETKTGVDTSKPVSNPVIGGENNEEVPEFRPLIPEEVQSTDDENTISSQVKDVKTGKEALQTSTDLPDIENTVGFDEETNVQTQGIKKDNTDIINNQNKMIENSQLTEKVLNSIKKDLEANNLNIKLDNNAENSIKELINNNSTEYLKSSKENVSSIIEIVTKSTKEENVNNILNNSEKADLSAKMKLAGVDSETIKNLLSKEGIDDHSLLKAIKLTLNKESTDLKGEIFKDLLLNDKSFNKIVQKGLFNKWTLEPRETAIKENVKEIFEILKRDMQEISQMASKFQNTSDSLVLAAKSVQNNVEFLNNVNYMLSYIQIPLKMSNKSAHGDLYVYSNKKSIENENGTVSAFLHLSMEKLGVVDCSLKLYKNKLDTIFSIEDEISLNLFKKNIEKLEKGLRNAGYSCDISFKDLDEHPNLAKEIMGNSGENDYKRYSFDVLA